MKKLHSLLVYLSRLLPDRSIKDAKSKWNDLADENGKYYIVSKEGKNIEEEMVQLSLVFVETKMEKLVYTEA
jgi:hypothetical protein